MNITVNEQDGRTLIALDGMLDTSTVQKFQGVVSSVTANEGIDIVMDLTKLEYVSSQGIRLFLTLIKTVIAKNGKLVFRGIQPEVMEILDMSGISEAMTIEK